MILAAQLTTVTTSDRRASCRREVDRDTTLRTTPDRPFDVRVRDLGAGGCFVETETPLAVGDEIVIGLSGAGSAPAVVVRQDGQGVGCRFLEPLDRTRLQQAFQNATLIEFRHDDTFADMFPEDVVSGLTPWPLAARAVFVAGSAAVLWAAILIILL